MRLSSPPLARIRNDATLIARGAAARLGRPDAPWKLTLALTWVCEQRCTHCRIWRRPRGEELSADAWDHVFERLGERLSWVDLTGGEVTTRADFAAIARSVVARCPRLALLHFPTNGRDPARVDGAVREILASRPTRLIVSISLDGPPALHDRLRGDDGAFASALETYRRLRARGVETYFGMTLSSYNASRVDETVMSLAAEIPGFAHRDLHVNLIHISPHFFQNQPIEDRARSAEVDDAFTALSVARGVPRGPTALLEALYLAHVPRYLETGRSPLPCASLSVNAFVDPAGTVFPCHIWDRPLAALADHDWDLARVWALAETRAARREIVEERCPGCWTPCEAYPTVLSNLDRAFIGAVPQPGHQGRTPP
ncbi:MAG: radical SAM protein [Myxococcales bacterium]|nr:radical SAM protein [Myxococcales bacterium]